MPALDPPVSIPLPKDWSKRVRSGAIHAISLARFSLTVARGHAANNWNARIRLKEENDRLRHEVVLLREELRIKDARMERIPAQRRPHYPPVERLAITRAPRRQGLVARPDRPAHGRDAPDRHPLEQAPRRGGTRRAHPDPRASD